MSRKNTILFLAIISFVIATISIITYFALPQQVESPSELTHHFESNAFSFSYPDGWQYQIPQINMLFLASPQILAQDAGATVTIQRSLAVATQADSLESALTFYLERGPLRSDRAWELASVVEMVEIDGYETLTVRVEGSEQAGTLPMRSQIYILQATNEYMFIVTTTAPIEQWDDSTSVFEAMLSSIDIIE